MFGDAAAWFENGEASVAEGTIFQKVLQIFDRLDCAWAAGSVHADLKRKLSRGQISFKKCSIQETFIINRIAFQPILLKRFVNFFA